MMNGIELGEFDIETFLHESEHNYNFSQGSASYYRRQIVIVVDASNSMQGYKIGAVNDCVNNILTRLKSLSRSQGGSIYISVIGFSTHLFRWTDGFVSADDFKYVDVETTDGITDINVLFDELVQLTKDNNDPVVKKSVVIFSDGLPTEEYSDGCSKWRETIHYKDINKIAVSFEEDINDPQSMEFFMEFTNHGKVIAIRNQEELLSALLI